MPTEGGYQEPLTFAAINFAIVGLFSGIISVILSGSGDYEGTVRILSYSSAVQVFAWIPVIGWIVSLYGIWLNIVGGKHVHNLTTVKSAIAVLLPVVILTVIIAMLMAVLIAAIAAMGISGLGGF